MLLLTAIPEPSRHAEHPFPVALPERIERTRLDHIVLLAQEEEDAPPGADTAVGEDGEHLIDTGKDALWRELPDRETLQSVSWGDGQQLVAADPLVHRLPTDHQMRGDALDPPHAPFERQHLARDVRAGQCGGLERIDRRLRAHQGGDEGGALVARATRGAERIRTERGDQARETGEQTQGDDCSRIVSIQLLYEKREDIGYFAIVTRQEIPGARLQQIVRWALFY
jgi:hypothetical protein